MKYELELLETFVKSPVKIEDELLFLDQECQRICSVFINTANNMDIDFLRKYFKLHQSSLCRLSDKIYNQLKQFYGDLPDSFNSSIISFRYVMKTLDGILTFMQLNLPAYFELDAKIPDSMVLDFVNTQTINHLYIENTLIEKGLHPTLITHLIEVLRFENRYPDQEITYSQHKNIMNLNNKLLEYLDKGDCETNNYKIHKLIISLNLHDNNVYL